MSGLFGGSKDFDPGFAGIKAGGLESFFTKTGKFGNIGIKASPERRGLVSALSQRFGARAGEFGRLRELVRPGFGEITESRVAAVERARQRATGDLRENLARRRVSGSSFGADTLARAEQEFGQAEADVRARSFLEELDASTRFLELQSNAQLAEIQTFINELNLEADIALKLSGQMSAALTANNQLLAQLAASNAQGIGAFGAFAADKIFGDTAILDRFGGGGAAGGSGSFSGTDAAGRILGGV